VRGNNGRAGRSETPAAESKKYYRDRAQSNSAAAILHLYLYLSLSLEFEAALWKKTTRSRARPWRTSSLYAP
jgi:hypothetical protein